MIERPQDILDVYIQDNGSMVFCCQDIRPKADARGYDGVVARADDTLAACEVVQKVEFDWMQSKKSGPAGRKEAMQTDIKIDRTLGQIHSIIKAFADVEDDTSQRQAARRVKANVLPRGVYPITSLKYEEQHRATDELCQRLTGQFAADVDALGLSDLVDSVVRMNETFRQQLVVHDDQVTFDEVLEARHRAEDLFAEVIFAVLTATFGEPEAREELLSAVVDQQRRIAKYRRRRGGIPAVDPDTGEIVDDTGDGPAPEPDTPEPDTPEEPAADDDVVEPAPAVE